ncbi:MAG TPA: T9SS type A sorting domain-containing protein, partial [Ignavibacteriaceae bacterium]|nr:T9SS type A sorting domain-containing protein [Ignavibacteriaceae bacterium]
SGTYYFAIRVNASATPWYLSFDDFRFDLAQVPAAPSNLTAAADTFAVLLNWVDNSSNELGFKIERKNGDSTSVDPFVEIDSVGVNATSYNDLGRTPNTTYTYRVRAFNQIGYSPYSNEVTATTIIPVELTSFAANVNDKEVLITWTTATELNNKGFDLERKLDDEWEKLSFIEGKGTRLEETSYSYTDKFSYTSYQGTAQYRLKQIDYDGTISYSNVISVELNFTPKEYALYQNYPNPFNPATTIKFALPFESSVKIVIYNLLGEKVEMLFDGVKEVGYHDIYWNASKLASGIYIYTIEANSLDGSKNFSSVKKMVLMK